MKVKIEEKLKRSKTTKCDGMISHLWLVKTFVWKVHVCSCVDSIVMYHMIRLPSQSICSHFDSIYCKSPHRIIEFNRHRSSYHSNIIHFFFACFFFSILFLLFRFPIDVPSWILNILLCPCIDLLRALVKNRGFPIRYNRKYIYTMLLSSNWSQYIDIDTIQYIIQSQRSDDSRK